jgi:hypothetical protein
MDTQELTQEKLRSVLHYDVHTGAFTWLIDHGNSRGPRIGKPAGSRTKAGYGVISLKFMGCGVHRSNRLALLYVTGTWPDIADHMDGRTENDASGNLRDVSTQINSQNRRGPTAASKSGVLGVHFRGDRKTRPWQAMLRTDYRLKHIGYFETKESAGEAVLSFKRQMHIGCLL